jgi:hypothetical protein
VKYIGPPTVDIQFHNLLVTDFAEEVLLDLIGGGQEVAVGEKDEPGDLEAADLAPAAFKHGLTQTDIRWAMATALFDELMDGYDDKYLLIGFSVSGNLIEVMYNLVGEDIANIFHAMKCRNDFLQYLSGRG